MTAIPTQALAATWYKHGDDGQIEQKPVKQPKDLAPGECLIRLHFSGVCHSDLSNSRNEFGNGAPLPQIFGHEGTGHIVAIGAQTETRLKVGDKVGVKYVQNACLECEMCLKGYESSCFEGPVMSGSTVPGTFQHYIVSFTRYLTPIPEGVDMAEAAPLLSNRLLAALDPFHTPANVIGAGVTVLNGLKSCQLSYGDWVAVPGAGGGLGHLAVQYAIAAGMRVVGIDTGAEKKQLVEEYGGIFIDFKEEADIVSAVRRVTDGRGPHGALISAASEGAYTMARDYLRDRGTLAILGLPPHAKLTLPILKTMLRGIRVVGCFVGNRQDAVEALQLHASGRAKLRYQLDKLENVNTCLEKLHQGSVTGRIVLDMTDEASRQE